MKKLNNIYLALFLVGLMFGLSSCEDEKFSDNDFQVKMDPVAYADQGGLYRNFFYASNQELFYVSDIDVNLSVFPGSDDQVIEKFEVYAYLIEEVDGEQVLHGGMDGLLYASFTDEDDLTDIKMKVSIDDIYDMYQSELLNNNRPAKFLTTDKVELKWVITDGEGNVSDGRIDEEGYHSQYIIGVDEGIVCPNDLSGTVEYEWIDAGWWFAVRFGKIGAVGEINIEMVSPDGKYFVDDCEFGGMGVMPADMSDDECSSVISLQSRYDTKWEFSNFNGSSVDVRFTNKYTNDPRLASMGVWGQVRLTRKDGKDWPTDLKGIDQ